MNQAHCTGNFKRIKKIKVRTTAEDKILKKFNEIVQESSVEAVKIIVCIFTSFKDINCVFF